MIQYEEKEEEKLNKVKSEGIMSNQIAEYFAKELFKSAISNKIKISYIELFGGSRNLKTKFSLDIKGTLELEDKEEYDYIKERFVDILTEYLGNKKVSLLFLDSLMSIKFKPKYAVGEKFQSIRDNFNIHGNTFNIEHEPGIVMLIDVWATWCGYCHTPMDENIKVWRDIVDIGKQNKIEIIAVSADDDDVQTLWKEFIKKKRWSELQHYRNSKIMANLGLDSIPHIIIVNQKGIVMYAGHPNEVKNLKKLLLDLSDGKEIILKNKENKTEGDKKDITLKDDLNPQWSLNPENDKKDIVDTINEMIENIDVRGVHCIVTTKTVYFDGGIKSYTQPIFSGICIDKDLEKLQEVAINIAENFNLVDIQFQVKAISINNKFGVEELKNLLIQD